MNYYPYGTQTQVPNYYQQPQPYQYQQPMLSQPQLNGKVVDSVDIVKITEVPMGSFGIYPKADQSEIYLKTWNVDGTTKIVTYTPVIEQLPEVKDPYADTLSDIKKQISELNKKFDSIKPSTPMARKKREVNDDE